MQRVRIGLTGLAFVFLVVLLAAVFTNSGVDEAPITPNLIEQQRGGSASGTDPSLRPAPNEPLAELGVAPGKADTNQVVSDRRFPRHGRSPDLRSRSTGAMKDDRAGTSRTLPGPGWLFLFAATFALAELAFGTLVGGFFDWGRAEALLFLAFRPGLLLILAFSLAALPVRRRYLAYALCLLVAGVGESGFLLAMGAANPWPEMLRGWIGGILLVTLADMLIQTGRRLAGRLGTIGAALIGAMILLIPASLRPYERIVLGAPESSEGPRPEVAVMTSLPIIWGETGAFGPGSRPSWSWKALQEDFELRPIDQLRPVDLADSKLLLLAQPRQLSPEELVTVDHWIRRGGSALILADPRLEWPSALPPGDARRPFATNMLAPLLSHWRIDFVPEPRLEGSIQYWLRSGGERRQLRILGSATLTSRGDHCRPEAPFMLTCRIGGGRAIVIADADLLHDSTLVPPGSTDAERHRRLSDNAVAIADWLDRLAGLERSRAPVQWVSLGAGALGALLLGLLPIAASLILAASLIVGGRRHAQTYPQPLQQRIDRRSGMNKPGKGNGIL